MNRLNQERLLSVGYCYNPKLTGNVDELHGDGVIGDLKDKFVKKFLSSRPKVINDLIKSEGQTIVERVEICRAPIMGIFEKLLNKLSFGMLKRKMKEFHYDKLFHLYVIVYLSNGSVYRIEKNQRMNIIKNPKKEKEAVCKRTVVGNINLETFITAPESNMEGLYRYTSFLNNCQDYISRLLNANGITQFNDFILQKVAELAPSYLKSIANRLTDVAGVADYFIKGGEYEGGGVYEKILGI